jgi:hypothetical protein
MRICGGVTGPVVKACVTDRRVTKSGWQVFDDDGSPST